MPKIELELERPISFYKQMARALGGINEALFAQQLYYWSDRGKRKDGYIYKTKKEWEEETCLSPKQQDKVVKKLKSLKIIATKLKKANGNPTLHYKLDIPMLQKVINQYAQREETNVTKGDIPITETTTETTTDLAPNVAKGKKTDLIISGDLIKEMSENTRIHVRRIALFAQFKGLEFKNKKHVGEFISRHSRSSAQLSHYSDERIIEVMSVLDENADFKWDIGTVLKYIDEPDLTKCFNLGKKGNNIIIG